MELSKVMRVPPVVTTAEKTVLEAVSLMSSNDVGAVIVVDSNRKVLGIFTERDNLLRVTLKCRDPKTTLVKDVMTTAVKTAPPDLDSDQALQRMLRSNVRHLPVVDREKRILGVASIRYLLTHRLGQQQDNIELLSAYVEAGGPG